MKKIPFKSQLNRALGLFVADPLGSVQGTKKVDMEKAKSIIRHNRKVRSGEFRKEQTKAATLRRNKQWWNYRQTWRRVTIGNFIGKLHPYCRGRVEFPDGTVQWLKL